MSKDVRLIDANALVKDLRLMAKYQSPDKCSVILGVRSTIEARKTIDAVPVVRCKDCKYHRVRECPMRSLDVNPAGRLYVVDNTDDDGFCYKGAKMDGGAEGCTN